ncbi:hypothetical protein FACS1894122_00540 [Alphaproteobacteria bacterium]|nr:hypothetical protein FACS1894122_00540 [Alphaproteobacteria bacterium]
MKTWYKADLFSSFLVIFGIICFIFSKSLLLAVACFMLASVILLHCVYKSRFNALKYRDLLCHYHSIMSLADNGWIAWSGENEYIGSSKKFRSFFDLRNNATIFIGDIIALVAREDAIQLSNLFGKMIRTGASFNITVLALANDRKIEINASKIAINGLETIILWGKDITKSFLEMQALRDQKAAVEKTLEEFRETLNVVPIPVWKRNGRLDITYCNKAYAEALDSSVEKILAQNLPLIPGNLFGQGHSLAENAKKCNRMQAISQFAVVKGVRRKLSVHEVPTSNQNLVGFAMDITSEESIASNLDRIVTANYEVLENLSTAIAIFGENTRLVFFNGAYHKLMKLEQGWLHSKPTYAEILDERRNNRQLPEHADFKAFKKSQLALFTSITTPVQELMHLPNGNTLRTVVAPYPLGGLIFIYEDVTDSLALQRKNNTLLAVQKETIDHLHEGIAVYGSDNRLKIVNNSILKIWKMEDKETSDLKGMHLSELLDIMKDSIDYGDDWKMFRENYISNLTDRISKSGKLMRKDNSVIDRLNESLGSFLFKSNEDGTLNRVCPECKAGELRL